MQNKYEKVTLNNKDLYTNIINKLLVWQCSSKYVDHNVSANGQLSY